MATFKGAAKEAQRAALLMKQREKERQELEFQKKKLASEMRVGEISTRFAVHYDSIEQQLRTETIGLVTLDEMKARQKAYMAQREQELALGDKANQLKSESSYADRKAKLQPSLLSFQDCDDDEEEVTEELSQIVNPPSVPSESPGSLDENKVNSSNPKDPALPFENTAVDVTPVDTTSEVPVKRRRLGKNPTVDTSFLPDIDRDEEEKRLREELRCEWVAKQATVKDEDFIITYSYWDGSGHRKQVRVKKGHSIHIFLCRCLEQLRKDFSELKGASADQLMFIKEDLIIPHHHTFYDFIVTKARGKSGALFCFDVHDDVRMVIDSKVERDESHAGKICLRSWYERNKHIFPASRWEPYDPTKNWDHYTISDKMAAKITVK